MSQSLRDFEVLIVNDGSTDATSDILRIEVDRRIRVITLPHHVGLSSALNIGIESARGTFIARLDSDDLCMKDRLLRQYGEMNRRRSLVLLGTAAVIIDSSGATTGHISVPLGTANLIRRLRWRNSLIHPSVMFRRDAVLEAGGYSLASGHFEDYDLWLRLACIGDIDNLGCPLIAYRRHVGQITQKSMAVRRAMSVVGTSRQDMATARNESVLAAAVRHSIWVSAQRVRDLGRARERTVGALREPEV